MFEKRTDLALEAHEICVGRNIDDGIKLDTETKDGFEITRAEISKGNGEEISGKPAGRYITVDVGKVWQYDSERFNKAALLLSAEIRKLLPPDSAERGVLVAGLGNENITPDSVGPRTVKKLIVTRHIKEMDLSLYRGAGFGCVSAIAPGVLGQTGVESAEIIKSVSDRIRPCCIIIIDALASRRLSRLATTVQLSDVGLKPGAGVSNMRCELSEAMLGVPVISLGIPTVVDAATLAHDLLEEHTGETDNPDFEKIIESMLSGSARSLFIAPKDSDVIARETSRLLSVALNLALHSINIEDIAEYTA